MPPLLGVVMTVSGRRKRWEKGREYAQKSGERGEAEKIPLLFCFNAIKYTVTQAHCIIVPFPPGRTGEKREGKAWKNGVIKSVSCVFPGKVGGETLCINII